MALQFAHGVVQWLAADAATTVYTISGLAFQPKAIRFTTSGLQSATDANSGSLDRQLGGGFAVSTSDRRCVVCFNDNANTAAQDISIYRTDAVAAVIDVGISVTGLLDINAINSDGFSLIVDDQTPQSLTVAWEAWGGSDITNAETFEVAEPATATTVEVNLSGAFQPVVAMLFGSKIASAADAIDGAIDTGFFHGFTTGSAAANNVVCVNNSDDASGTMDTDHYLKSGECIAQIVEGGGTAVACRALLSSFDADGLTFNYVERAVTGRRTIGLAIAGGLWTAGSYTIDGSTGSATATVSGLAYQPVGGLLFGRNAPQSTSDTADTDFRLEWGVFSSTSSRRSMSIADFTGGGTVAVEVGIEYDQVLGRNLPSLLTTLFDINAINSDGFQIIVDDATGGNANTFHAYLTFGSSPAAATTWPGWVSSSAGWW